MTFLPNSLFLACLPLSLHGIDPIFLIDLRWLVLVTASLLLPYLPPVSHKVRFLALPCFLHSSMTFPKYFPQIPLSFSLIYIISDNLPSLNSSVQLCLNLANLWMLKNGLKLNTLKSKCILIHSSWKKVDGNLELFVDGLPIEQVRVFKFLGVLLNDTLTRSDHIAHICTKVSRSWTCSGVYHGFFLNPFFCSTSSPMLFQPLTIVMLCGPTVPMLKLNALKLFSTTVVVLFFTSLAFTLPPLPDSNLILLL